MNDSDMKDNDADQKADMVEIERNMRASVKATLAVLHDSLARYMMEEPEIISLGEYGLDQTSHQDGWTETSRLADTEEAYEREVVRNMALKHYIKTLKEAVVPGQSTFDPHRRLGEFPSVHNRFPLKARTGSRAGDRFSSRGLSSRLERRTWDENNS